MKNRKAIHIDLLGKIITFILVEVKKTGNKPQVEDFHIIAADMLSAAHHCKGGDRVGDAIYSYLLKIADESSDQIQGEFCHQGKTPL